MQMFDDFVEAVLIVYFLHATVQIFFAKVHYGDAPSMHTHMNTYDSAPMYVFIYQTDR